MPRHTTTPESKKINLLFAGHPFHPHLIPPPSGGGDFRCVKKQLNPKAGRNIDGGR